MPGPSQLPQPEWGAIVDSWRGCCGNKFVVFDINSCGCSSHRSAEDEQRLHATVYYRYQMLLQRLVSMPLLLLLLLPVVIMMLHLPRVAAVASPAAATVVATGDVEVSAILFSHTINYAHYNIEFGSHFIAFVSKSLLVFASDVAVVVAVLWLWLLSLLLVMLWLLLWLLLLLMSLASSSSISLSLFNLCCSYSCCRCRCRCHCCYSCFRCRCCCCCCCCGVFCCLFCFVFVVIVVVDLVVFVVADTDTVIFSWISASHLFSIITPSCVMFRNDFTARTYSAFV